MKSYFHSRLPLYGVILLFVLLAGGQTLRAQERITVIDRVERVPIISAHVRVGHFQATTDRSGSVLLPSTVSARDTIHVTYVGFVPEAITLRALRRQRMTIRLRYDETMLEGVSVQAERRVSNTSIGEYLSADKLEVGISTELAEVLRDIKGVSVLTTGSGDVVPSVHGMYGDRLLIVSNGVRQQSQQWSTEFTPKVDFAGGSIAVLKGAEAVRYGSDALGGVILHESASLPYRSSAISGMLQAQYGTNGRTVATQGSVEGALGESGAWAWRVRGKWFRGGDRSTPNYLLNNTGTIGGDASAALGWSGARSGAELYYSYINHSGAVFYGAQMGNIDVLKERIRLGRPEVTTPFSYTIDYPKHNVVHRYVRAKGYVDFDDLGRVEMQIAYQRDRQREYHYRRNYRSHIPAVSLTLNNVQGTVRWLNSYMKYWSSEVGLYGSRVDNFNEPGTGVVPLIPNYVSYTASGFGIQKYESERWGAEVGARYDHSYLNAAGIDLYRNAYGGVHRYDDFTYNIGMHYRLMEGMELKTHFGTAFRSPNVSELYSNGLDLSGGIYLRGDSTMTTERNRKWVTTLSYTDKKVSASIEGYLQWIDGYIYQEPQSVPVTVISGTYPCFRYRQTGATMHGVDADVTWRIGRGLEYHAQAGMILAAERTTGRYLPLIPPPSFSQSLRWEIEGLKNQWSAAPSVELEHRYTAKQRRFDPQTDLIETTPPAFHLLGMNLKWGILLPKGQRLDFYLTVENMLNKEYKEYTNSGRYYAHSPGRDVRFSLKYKF